uniref:F-box associated beta-propeller type 1 domain-containing protein n=1 Tax=Solanum tuberosum TaxID=4113 RepID=M1DWV9_SOLTU
MQDLSFVDQDDRSTPINEQVGTTEFDTLPARTSGYKVYCCCDALFLIGIWTGLSWDEPTMLLLWNSTTSESIVFPPLESSLEQDSTYELGYDSTSNDKVLRIDKEIDALDEILALKRDEILALKSGSWRGIYSPSKRFGGDASMLHGKECLSFVNGVFHWFDY